MVESLISMETYKFLYCFFIILHSSTASNHCSTSYCGQTLIEIRSPFQLTDQNPKNCGFAGFDLHCVFPSTLRINIPRSGNFTVRSIDYASQAIRIYDPLNCLPARLLTFDLSNSRFSAFKFQNFTLLSCPHGASLFGFRPIDCLSNSSVSVLASDSKIFVTSMTSNQSGCVITGHVRVPVDRAYDDGFTSQLDEDLSLRWSTPDCENCETNGIDDGTKSSSIFRVIGLIMSIPTMTVFLIIACCMCTKDRRNEFTTITTTAAPPNIVGLDHVTIESYTKVVLGESKRLPGHGDIACPICLSEYNVEETVRCIPACRHCFHSECIDEWLKINATCPICRISPSPLRVESQHIC